MDAGVGLGVHVFWKRPVWIRGEGVFLEWTGVETGDGAFGAGRWGWTGVLEVPRFLNFALLFISMGWALSLREPGLCAAHVKSLTSMPEFPF